jgi:glucose/arabinose dehydrogenase
MRLIGLFAVLLLGTAAGCSRDVPVNGPTAAATSQTVAPSTAEPGRGTSAPVPASPGLMAEPVRVALRTVGEGFVAPVHAFAHAGRSFVVEQVGRVTDLDDRSVWLNIDDRVRFDGEQGLLGVAVHPGGGHVAVHYSSTDGATTLATFLLRDGRPDVSTETVVLRVPQPAANHNGGSILFAPDGRLLLALGDGGGAGDQFQNGQDPSTLLGAIVRLDLDDPAVARVPSDNPFVGGGGAPEVWLYGVRNPYRIAVGEGQVYIADVGQNAVEEVTVLPLSAGGANLGWPQVEGDRCYRDGCDLSAYEPADVAYTHDSVDGCSVIGGHVYAGQAIEGLTGHFLYGDLCGGILRTVRASGGDVVAELDLTSQVGSVRGVTGIGVGADGEALLTFSDGTVRRLVPAS